MPRAGILRARLSAGTVASPVHGNRGRRRTAVYGTAAWPACDTVLVAFSFGLLHGFGFAGALTEIGLPQGDIPLALFTFNVGVEVGQLIFIAAVLSILTSAKSVLELQH